MSAGSIKGQTITICCANTRTPLYMHCQRPVSYVAVCQMHQHHDLRGVQKRVITCLDLAVTQVSQVMQTIRLDRQDDTTDHNT